MMSGELRLGAVLGAGGEACVRRATLRNRRVACKPLRNRTEPDVLTHMGKHDHIVQLLHVLPAEGGRAACMLMPEYPSDLFSVLARGGPLPLPRTKTLMRHLLSALRHAHAHGVCHSDVKHENILVDRHGGFVLADWGLARRGKPGHITLHGPRGSPDFRPPEASRRTPYSGAAADVWAAGVVLSYTLVVLGVSHTVDERGRPRVLLAEAELAGVPDAGAVALLRAMLEADPALRPTSAQLLQHPWLRADDAATVAARRRLRVALQLPAHAHHDGEEVVKPSPVSPDVITIASVSAARVESLLGVAVAAPRRPLSHSLSSVEFDPEASPGQVGTAVLMHTDVDVDVAPEEEPPMTTKEEEEEEEEEEAGVERAGRAPRQGRVRRWLATLLRKVVCGGGGGGTTSNRGAGTTASHRHNHRCSVTGEGPHG